MAKLKLSSPWERYYQEVCALFKEDPEIHVVLDDDAYALKIYVDDNEKKADALSKLMPESRSFGNIELKIEVIPSNTGLKTPVGSSLNWKFNEESPYYFKSLYAEALRGNRNFAYTSVLNGVYGFTATYVVFKKQVIQYFNDDLSDINGLCSTLAQEIAKDVFAEHNGVFYCTSVINYYANRVQTSYYNNCQCSERDCDDE